MRSKWITLAVGGSLGAFAWWGLLRADDNSPDLASNSAPAASVTPAASEAETANHERAQSLLRRATAELEANRFAAARNLVKQAVESGATFSVFDLRPEQVSADIERRQQTTDGASGLSTSAADKPADMPSQTDPAAERLSPPSALPRAKEKISKVPAEHSVVNVSVAEDLAARPGAPEPKLIDSNARLKSQAIVLLDRGLLALDEKRFDDAERLAIEAAQLRVVWEKYDYRPQNLLDEVRQQRSLRTAGTAAEGSPVPIGDVLSDSPLAAKPAAPAASTVAVGPAAPVMIQPSAAANARQSPIAVRADGGPLSVVPSPQRAETRRPSLAETLLEEALADLRAGRDDLAHQRIERALRLVKGSHPLAGSASAANLAAPSPYRPTTTGFDSGRGYSASAGTAYPANQFAPSSASTANPHIAGDLMKPLHDPFLGDDAAPTQSASAGEQKLRESVPQATVSNSASSAARIYMPKRSALPPEDSSVYPADYATSPAATNSANSSSPPPTSSWADGSSAATSTVTKTQMSPAMSPVSPQVDWLEKMSSPVPPNGAAPQFAGNPPSGPPTSSSGSWSSSGRPAYTPNTDPAANIPTDDQPGFFRKVWNSMRGQ